MTQKTLLIVSAVLTAFVLVVGGAAHAERQVCWLRLTEHDFHTEF